MTVAKRKGASSRKAIPEWILDQLNRGELETVNLVEWLAVDQLKLLAYVLGQLDRERYLPAISSRIEQLPKRTVNTVNQSIGTTLLEQATAHNDTTLLAQLTGHRSDLVRCWASYLIGGDQTLSVWQMLQQIEPFAADAHFGVREIAWLAVRPRIAQHLPQSISILADWTSNPDENIRRFASEATRPRGVWCAHIEALKQHPHLGLPILEPLKADPARYVQDSVGNWLNDASKTQPRFVSELCQRWQKESNTKATSYITRKALRTLAANPNAPLA